MSGLCKILLTISYDGTAYHGWQNQNNAVSVQEKVEEALSGVFAVKSLVKITGASRTDTGVHALDQKASFFIEKNLVKIPLINLPLVLNSKLPPDIKVTDARFVGESFHPRYNAKEKTYRYQILNSKYPNPMLNNYAWHVHYKLNMSEMKKAARLMVGTFNFSAFCASGSSAKTFVRSVYEVKINEEPESSLLTVFVRGNGFLYNMVRIMAGTLMYTGCGKIDAEKIPEIIKSGDRTLAGITAPPQGLTLYKVSYTAPNQSVIY
ncbi:MAG: tRNA pseudouridine(38-40) synthase TruA [Clostridiales bacterium]|nr:tRNA pseudouridine(38-40) synthase TruA [Clostridiales bacterium]